jgi:glycosyltransferase involved in cell wall biosynthesis
MSEERLRVLLVSTSFPRSPDDWQGRFIADMTAALVRRRDMDLRLWAPFGGCPEGAASAVPKSDARWLALLADRGGIAAQLRRGTLRAAPAAVELLYRLRRLYRSAHEDLVHVNWLQNALPLWRVSRPLLVTVLGTDFALMKLKGMTTALRRVFEQRKTVIAPNAPWMAEELERRFGSVARVQTVPFGVAAEWFEVDRSSSDTPLWIAVTRLTRAKLEMLFEWGDRLFDGTRQLHLFGPMQESVTIPDWVRWHGPTHPAELRERWFPRATGLVTLSRHDEGRPQVMLEAMASGVPVVASSLPAHRDFVRHGETGWIADTADRLREGLIRLEDAEESARVGAAAREWIRRMVGTWDDCAGRYARLYRELVSS